jgi:hypothetical protein
LEETVVKPTNDILVRRAQWAKDGTKAWQEYLAAPDLVATKTARLRQERLEREAVEKVAAEKTLTDRASLANAIKAKRSLKKTTEKLTDVTPKPKSPRKPKRAVLSAVTETATERASSEDA